MAGLVIPEPDQVPPAVAAFRITLLTLLQKGPADVMVALAEVPTVMVAVSVLLQTPVEVYITLKVPLPTREGENCPVEVLVIPCPDQMPPALAAVRVTNETLVQYGPVEVMVGLFAGFIVMLRVSSSPQLPAIV